MRKIKMERQKTYKSEGLSGMRRVSADLSGAKESVAHVEKLET